MNAHKFVRHAFAEMNHDDMKWLKGDNINVMNIYSGVNLHLKPPRSPSKPPAHNPILRVACDTWIMFSRNILDQMEFTMK